MTVAKFHATAALFLTGCAVLVAWGCSGVSPSSGDEDLGESEFGIRARLLDEGTCQFLACNSSYSPQVPPNSPGSFQCPNGQWRTVSFACTGTSIACDDNDIWLVSPTRRCGATRRVCYNGQSVIAPIRDTSNANAWEASRGLQAALGISPGANPRVTILQENDSSWQTDPACVGSGNVSSSSSTGDSSSSGDTCSGQLTYCQQYGGCCYGDGYYCQDDCGQWQCSCHGL